MHDPSTFKITPSFIAGIIRQSSHLKSEADVIRVFEKLSLFKDKTLDESHTQVMDPAKEHEIIFGDVPESLRPFAEALYSLVAVSPEDQDEE